MGFLSRDQLNEMGFKNCGKNVLISDKASIYNPGSITLGHNVRIDDFCILSAGEGGIELGNYIHIACYTSLIGKGKIVLEDFVNLSSKIALYSSNDDYSGEFLTNPTIPVKYTNVTSADVILKKHVIVGAGCIILPGITLEEGVAVGALSLVRKNCEAFSIYMGNPAKKIKNRSRKLLDIEKELRSNE